ncbi:MAG TPA: hypothetical protein VKW06_10480 [Candidatus Angelobacter sp.]|nr:hypothetical protein [Candidatus Angelobacter sp.]
MKTPPHFRAYNIPDVTPSRKLWRAHLAYRLGDKKEYLSIMWAMEHAGCLPQLGDPAKNVDRVTQETLAGMLAITRSTTTKRIAKYSAPDPTWDADRRRRHAEKMRAVAANHPHWTGEHGGIGGSGRADTMEADTMFPGAVRQPDRRQADSSAHVSPVAGESAESDLFVSHRGGENDGTPLATPSPVVPLAGETLVSQGLQGGMRPSSNAMVDGLSDRPDTVLLDGADRNELRHVRKHVACILTHHPGFGQANFYSLAMPESARPEIQPGRNHAAILAAHFGEKLFDSSSGLSGFRKSYGWIWHPNLPDARPCECRLGQRKLKFLRTCPTCGGTGRIITSPALGNGPGMPDYGRVLLHWLLDRGIDEEIRGASGQITKHRGILEGWTQEAIGEMVGMNVSTIRRYFKAFRLLNIVRTIPGKVTKRCAKCDKTYTGKCAGCGNTGGSVVDRDPHKILWLPSRTLDRDLVRAEKARIEALVAIHRHWLDRRQQEQLENAAALSLSVLEEWSGKEHKLTSFWSEMRRRLAATAWLLNVLFPLKT